jgi:CO/xanthine dehydrogenase FAD-binding subunit
MTYLRPASLDEALSLLERGPHVLLAGGTDLYPATAAARLDGPVIDLGAVPDLGGIATGPDGGLRIGAGVTWADLARATLPPALAGLQAAAQVVGGVQIQNAGTVGGNLCNASPAADGVPPLLTLDAAAELAGPGGVRRLPLADFIAGPRRTARRADEILVALHLPPEALTGQGAFAKLGARAHLVISIAMVAVRLVVAGGRVQTAALAVGACSPVARRLPAVEAALVGATRAEAAGRVDPAAVAAALAPLDDHRASAAYRAGAAAELLRRAVTEALEAA